MSKFFTLFITILLALNCWQCRKDVITVTTSGPTPAATSNNVDFLLQVNTAEGEALANAQVKNLATGEDYQTDENGRLLVFDQDINSIGLPLQVEAEGYFSQLTLLQGLSNSRNVAKVNLLTRSLVETSVPGATVMLPQGGALILPNDLVDKNGNPYNGNVQVYAHYHNPTDLAKLRNAPGELLAITADNRLQTLLSYGMLSVELTDDLNNSLQPAANAVATVRFPLTAAQAANAPETIALWHLNETTVLWEQEGEATLSNGTYTAEVTHFSTWNVDIPFTPVKVCFQLENEDGIILSNQLVRITDASSIPTYSFGSTDTEGRLCLYVPADELFSLELQLPNDLGVETVALAPLSMDTDLGKLTFSFAVSEVKGLAFDCNLQPRDGAIVQAIQGGQLVNTLTNESGQYSLLLRLNEPADLRGYDLIRTQQSPVQNIIPNSSLMEAADLTICDPIPPGQVITVNNDISEDMTMRAGNTYILEGIIKVRNNAVLTIEPGVVVKGKTFSQFSLPSALVITPGAKLMADGRAAQPIIFTAYEDPIVPGQLISPLLDSQRFNSWAGVFLLGKAPASTTEIYTALEGFPDDPEITYGGDNPADDSGTLRYVSIRYTYNNPDISPMVLGAVGNGTTIEHLELYSEAKGGGISILGGTVDLRDIVIQGTRGFLVQSGWSGTLENFIYYNVYSPSFQTSGITISGGEEINPSFTLRNGSCKSIAQLDHYVSLRSNNVHCLLENIYFTNHSEIARFAIRSDELAQYWTEGDLAVSNLQFNLSHLPTINNITDVFTDESPDEIDCFTIRPPNATVVTTSTTGANVTPFRRWTMADDRGALDDL